MTRYHVYAGDRVVAETAGLVGACTAAREGARTSPGIKYRVERDGVVEARYHLAGNAVKAWVR